MSASSVSVVIPTWNADAYLPDSIDSALRQDLTPLEVIVVDDGSTDATPDVLDRFKGSIRVLRQSNQGVAAARNLGIAESRGEYVAFLDADDVWRGDKLRLQMAMLSSAAGAGCAYTAFVEVASDLTPLRAQRDRQRPDITMDLLFEGNVVGTPSTVICRRELLTQVGAFDTKFGTCADWDLWVRLADRTRFAYLDVPLVYYRRHGSNMSRDVPALERESRLLLERGMGARQLPFLLRSQIRARNDMVLAGSYFQAGSYGDFFRCAAAALGRDPLQAGRLAGFPLRWLRGRYRENAPADRKPWRGSE